MSVEEGSVTRWRRAEKKVLRIAPPPGAAASPPSALGKKGVADDAAARLRNETSRNGRTGGGRGHIFTGTSHCTSPPPALDHRTFIRRDVSVDTRGQRGYREEIKERSLVRGDEEVGYLADAEMGEIERSLDARSEAGDCGAIEWEAQTVLKLPSSGAHLAADARTTERAPLQRRARTRRGENFARVCAL